MSVIGIDTSNYTTSVAWFDGRGGENCSRLLPVKQGELGLRQSDAVFSHIKSLPELSGRLFSHFPRDRVQAIGVSTRPRAVEGSYMPCFMVGYSHAKLLSDTLQVPLVEVSHQQGHVAASLWSADRLDLMDTPHLAWHLSGGTTELLLVEPEGKNVSCSRIGGTTDISAGQLIDRTGQLLGLSFPSGKALDVLSADAHDKETFRVKCENSLFSFSGLQNKVSQFYEKTQSPAETAAYALRCVSGNGTGNEGLSRIHRGFFRRRCFQCYAAGNDEAPASGICPAPVFDRQCNGSRGSRPTNGGALICSSRFFP